MRHNTVREDPLFSDANDRVRDDSVVFASVTIQIVMVEFVKINSFEMLLKINSLMTLYTIKFVMLVL